jgi:predicted lipoprotein
VISRRYSSAAMLVLAALALDACKIVATSKRPTGGGDDANSDFDPSAMVAAIWDSKVIPYLSAKAGPLPDVVALARSDPDAAGRKFGHRAKEGSEPWTYVVKIDGRIVGADTASRAGAISVDNAGDGKVAAIVQIGPAMRGTALRDSLDFVSFNDFRNQIEYARFGKAFNQRVAQTILAHLPRESLVGRKVTILGASTLDSGDQPPLVSPAQLMLGTAP